MINQNIATFVQNQTIGTVIAALLKTVKYTRNAKPAKLGEYQQPVYGYHGYPVLMHARTQESYQFNADATQHAIEDASIASDHIILRPVRLELSFEVNNMGGDEVASTALDHAINIWQNRQLFDIITTHRYLENMICLNLTPENTAPEWGALRFRASFQQISRVQLQTVLYAPDNVLGGQPLIKNTDTVNASSVPSGPANGLSVVKPSQKSLKAISQAVTSSDVFKSRSFNNYFLGTP